VDYDKPFKIVEHKAAIVRRAFELAASGLGSYAIVRRFNAENVPNISGNDGWAKSTVEKLLRNRAVIGDYQPKRLIDGRRVNEGPPKTGYYPAILNEKLFLDVQLARSSRLIKGAGRRGSMVPNLFSQIARCYHCGEAIHLQNKGELPKGGKYLRCYSSLKNSGCTAGSWRYEEFEKSFLYFLRNEIDLHALLNADQLAQQKQVEMSQLAEIDDGIKSLELERDNIFSLIPSDAPIAPGLRAYIIERTEGITKQIDDLISQRNERAIKPQPKWVETSPSDHTNLLAEFAKGDEVSEDRRQLLKREISKVALEILLAPDGLELPDMMGAGGQITEKIFGSIYGTDAFKKEHSKIFKVKFRDGSRRTVAVSAENPTDYAMIDNVDVNSVSRIEFNEPIAKAEPNVDHVVIKDPSVEMVKSIQNFAKSKMFGTGPKEE